MCRRRPGSQPEWRAWLLVLLFSGCGPTPGTPSEPGKSGAKTAQAPLRIAAATDLQRVLPRLVERYQSNTRTNTALTFGSSGQLSQQIKAGAPFDLFLAANVTFVSDLSSAGEIQPDTVKPYARGSLVLVFHKGVGDEARRMSDLTSPAIKKIAIANPEYAPYGTAARQALERSGLWSKVSRKIVLAESVRQALAYAQQGDAEAAFVGKAISDVPEIRVCPVDVALYDPLVQALGIVARSSRPREAAEFARFLLGPEGQSILQDAGFSPPPSP